MKRCCCCRCPNLIFSTHIPATIGHVLLAVHIILQEKNVCLHNLSLKYNNSLHLWNDFHCTTVGNVLYGPGKTHPNCYLCQKRHNYFKIPENCVRDVTFWCLVYVQDFSILCNKLHATALKIFACIYFLSIYCVYMHAYIINMCICLLPVFMKQQN